MHFDMHLNANVNAYNKLAHSVLVGDGGGGSSEPGTRACAGAAIPASYRVWPLAAPTSGQMGATSSHALGPTTTRAGSRAEEE